MKETEFYWVLSVDMQQQQYQLISACSEQMNDVGEKWLFYLFCLFVNFHVAKVFYSLFIKYTDNF